MRVSPLRAAYGVHLMGRMNKNRNAKKLEVRKEKLRVLRDGQLGNVAGQGYLRDTVGETPDCMSYTVYRCLR